MTFSFLKSELLDPSIMIERLNNDQIDRVITAELIRQDLLHTEKSYFNILNEQYESNQDDTIMNKLFQLNELIAEQVKSSGIGDFTIWQILPLELEHIELLNRKI